ncbi:SRPBCC family protein [Allomuricauda sp. SCSIO 65647]|uniref:SRPBCC family protein n=1 Tax=Allomuricauda sp. SCSIO 65647 TaxID=2908843 RepID=UPI001F40DC83|nr:SRPBCC family protein [Muricauda sp. SCSIO 65647]UJH67722.1 SRPBCC family protein [Muricauda sp. SCSIO 65647]
MRYLKYTLGIIVLLFIVFLLIGLLKPEVSYDAEITVDKPLAESWAVTQDEEKLAAWLPGFQKIEHLSGTPGTVGAVANVHFVADGEQMVIRETITDIVPNESIAMTYENDFMNMHYRMAMTAVEGKTKISSRSTAWGNGMFAKSMMAFMGRGFKAQEETNLANLKKTIEENTKNYFPVEEEVIEASEAQQ